MKGTSIKLISEPELKEPLLIEGLPGMGYVGKLAAEHLIAELHAEKFAEMYSNYFIHHVYVEPKGTVRLARAEFYSARAGKRDVVILVGDVQAISPQGHYDLANKILDLAERLNVRELVTLGGYATGRYVKTKPKVIGVASSPELTDAYRRFGVVVEKGAGPIVGTSGLLLTLGKLRGLRGICLLGETHGMLIDHRSAQSVLEVLTKALGIEVDMAKLEQRAKETEQLLSKIGERLELRARRERPREEEEAWYIG